MPTPAARKPKLDIDIVNRQRGYRLDRRRLVLAARVALAAERVRSAQVEIAVVGDREMARLNRRFLGRRGPTDVLSFDLGTVEKRGRPLFQIVVSADTARRRARRLGHPIIGELALYVVHGLLHLLGHDDRAKAGREKMHVRERELLARAAFRLSG